mmetsp:Transcript_57536/g.186960  ORF Transcript_57536/g.186960 Transcript_57536/m.186960 type:complete len:203 (+) Transcript_57536:378-986(+)
MRRGGPQGRLWRRRRGRQRQDSGGQGQRQVQGLRLRGVQGQRHGGRGHAEDAGHPDHGPAHQAGSAERARRPGQGLDDANASNRGDPAGRRKRHQTGRRCSDRGRKGWRHREGPNDHKASADDHEARDWALEGNRRGPEKGALRRRQQVSVEVRRPAEKIEVQVKAKTERGWRGLVQEEQVSALSSACFAFLCEPLWITPAE